MKKERDPGRACFPTVDADKSFFVETMMTADLRRNLEDAPGSLVNMQSLSFYHRLEFEFDDFVDVNFSSTTLFVFVGDQFAFHDFLTTSHDPLKMCRN